MPIDCLDLALLLQSKIDVDCVSTGHNLYALGGALDALIANR